MGSNQVQDLAERVEALLAEVEASAVPSVAERVEELVRSLLEMYGAGLDRVVDVLAGDSPGSREALLRRLAGDELTSALLVLHDLHPDDVTMRVTHALEAVRPYLGSHAGGVELLGVDEEAVVHLRLEGSCDGCPSSSQTVRNAIEDAILTAAPDVVSVDVLGMVAERPLLQIQPFRDREPALHATEHDAAAAETGWQHVDVDVPPRSVQHFHVAGEPVLVANLDGTLVAYLDRCPGCAEPPSGGVLAGDVLTCRGCGGQYDVRLAGRGLDSTVDHLDPLPLLPEGAGWKLALPTRTGT